MYEELIKRLRETPSIPVDAKMHNEAADAIEGLSADYESVCKDVERLEALIQMGKPKWIPVTERLPEKHEFVLVRSKFVKMRTDFINNDGKWYTTPGVTHWMPLPEPPEREKE